MVTFGVNNLNCNIFHELEKQTISFWTQKWAEPSHPRFNKKYIPDGIELILNNNSFKFDNKDYIQSHQTTTGTK